MQELGLVVLLFVLVPGFIADQAYSMFRVKAELSETERVLRSLVFSAFGLSAYLALGALIAWVGTKLSFSPWAWTIGPPYIGSLTSSSGTTEATRIRLDATALLALTWHIIVSSLVAVAWAKFLSIKAVEKFATQQTGRSLQGGGPWGTFWSQKYTTDDTGAELKGNALRRVSVALGDGSLILGEMQLVNDSAREGCDIVLGNPLFYDAPRQLLRAEGIRYMYIPGEHIASVRLSAAGAEQALRGYFNLDMTPVSSVAAGGPHG